MSRNQKPPDRTSLRQVRRWPSLPPADFFCAAPDPDFCRSAPSANAPDIWPDLTSAVMTSEILLCFFGTDMIFSEGSFVLFRICAGSDDVSRRNFAAALIA